SESCAVDKNGINRNRKIQLRINYFLLATNIIHNISKTKNFCNTRINIYAARVLLSPGLHVKSRKTACHVSRDDKLALFSLTAEAVSYDEYP
ncbi:MAG TPA: hypothetical protein PLA88_08580, partial [Bacteroidales bacterium]|nr:hypothetical protein [Bacteroidales bacterium]